MATTRKKGTARRLAAAAVVLAVLALLGTSPAHADLCGDCRKPTMVELGKEMGFELKRRINWLGIWSRDYVKLEGGPCHAEIEGDVTVKQGPTAAVVRGTGSVWNCPHSSSSSTITQSVATGDSTTWRVTGTGSVNATVLGVGLSAEISKAVENTYSIDEVTTVSTTIRASFCHVIGWKAMFDIAPFEAEADVKVSRTWDWKTYNQHTGKDVHARGTCTVDCGGGRVVLARRAAIRGYFRLAQGPCTGGGCEYVKAVDLGVYPPPYATPEDEEEGKEAPADEEARPEEAAPEEGTPEEGTPEEAAPKEDAPEEADAPALPDPESQPQPPTGE